MSDLKLFHTTNGGVTEIVPRLAAVEGSPFRRLATPDLPEPQGPHAAMLVGVGTDNTTS